MCVLVFHQSSEVDECSASCADAVMECRQLQKQRTRHISSVIIRDSLRTELSKQRSVVDDVRDRRDQLKIDIDILNMMISRAEEQMIQLRKRYEDEIQKRNERLHAHTHTRCHASVSCSRARPTI